MTRPAGRVRKFFKLSRVGSGSGWSGRVRRFSNPFARPDPTRPAPRDLIRPVDSKSVRRLGSPSLTFLYVYPASPQAKRKALIEACPRCEAASRGGAFVSCGWTERNSLLPRAHEPAGTTEERVMPALIPILRRISPLRPPSRPCLPRAQPSSLPATAPRWRSRSPCSAP